MIAKDNLIKKVIGLNIFQTAIFLFFISLADIGPLPRGTAPIVSEEMISMGYVYENPLPHVLILTAIVVAVATTAAVALALVIRMYEEYGTIEESEIIEKEREVAVT